jgi:hypothetical protein
MTSVMPRDPDDHANGSEPDLNELAAFVDRRVDDSARQRVVDHLAECARCRSIVAELTRSAERRVEPRWIPRALAVAATLAIAVAGGGLYWAMRERAPAVESPRIAPAPAVAPSEPARPAAESPAAPRTPAAADGRAHAASPTSSQSDRTRSAGTKSIRGKVFRLVAGEWIDTAYRRADVLPIVEIDSRSELDAHSQLRAFSVLGSRFTVVLDGTVYRVQLPIPAK